MLIFLAPGLKSPDPLAPGERVVRAAEGLIEVAYSRLPEHASAKQQVVALNLRSVALAEALKPALPEALHEFWDAYAGWFAMYSISPLLANREIARQALEAHPDRQAVIRENWRDLGWWSGRAMLQPALLDDLRAAGLGVQTRPGALLHSLRRPLAEQMATRALRREFGAELKRFLRGISADLATDPGDILWLSLGASSADLIARLVPALQASHGLSSQILDYHYFGSDQALERHGLPYTDIARFSSPAVLQSGVQVQRDLPHWWPQIRKRAQSLPPARELPPALFAAILDRLRLVLTRDAPPWVVRAGASQAALAAYRPQVVVATHVYGPPIAPTITAANRLRIPTVCLQHGVIGPRYLALPCQPYNEQLLFGDYPAAIISQVCPPQTKVTVTGHCLYDVTQTPATPRPEVQALRAGVKGLVVLCTQFNEPAFYRAPGWWLQGVAEACRALDARLVLKLHPSDSKQNLRLYRTLLREGDDRVQLAPHGQWPLSELLAACDLMITRDSTVVFEANLLGKPALTINLSEWDEELPYAATGGARGVYRYEDIAPALAALLGDEQARAQLAAGRERFLQAQTGPRDGRATERIASAIAAWASPR